MSSLSSSCSENSLDSEELLEIRNRCNELRKEKDLWKESQSQSFELIRRLELHTKTLSEAQTEDKKRIEQLERELNNCSQEIGANIDYLQDQLNARNREVNSLDEHVCNLRLKITNMENLEEEVIGLSEELKISNSNRSYLVHELENKEVELQKAVACIDKLEESISSTELEYQCEIESMNLNLLALQQNLADARKSQKETALENARLSNLVQDLESKIQDDKKIIECLENEKKDLTEKLWKSDMGIKLFRQKVDEQFQGWLVDKELFCCELGENTRTGHENWGPLLSILEMLKPSDVEWREKTDEMLQKMHGYELLVSQLKEELKEEKFKAKEEAEDLAQEMAELRYQMTGLLEEERKRRACVEQISLQRIAELEDELEKERSKSLDHQEQEKCITIFKHTLAA